MRLSLASWLVGLLLATNIMSGAAAKADSLDPLVLNAKQRAALLGQTTINQDGFALDIVGFDIRFLDAVKISQPGFPDRNAVPLGISQTLRFADLRAQLEQTIIREWNANVKSSCNDRYGSPHNVRVETVNPRQILIRFDANIARYACWSYDAPRCEIKWDFQKCDTVRVEGNTLLFERDVDFRLTLTLSVIETGLTFVPSIQALNLDDINRFVKIFNDVLRPILQVALGSLISPVLAPVLALPELQIIPKLESPENIISRLGLPSQNFDLDNMRDDQLKKLSGIGMGADGPGSIDIRPQFKQLKTINATLSLDNGKISIQVLSATPAGTSFSEHQAVVVRIGLTKLLTNLVRYKDSKENPQEIYEVARGDSLWTISERLYGNPYLFLSIGGERTLVKAGQHLAVTPYHELVDEARYRVGNGRSRWDIAREELGDGRQLWSIDVERSDCRRLNLIYPAQKWAAGQTNGCKYRPSR